MFRKSEFPPTFSCIVLSRCTPRSRKTLLLETLLPVVLARDEDRHAVHHRAAGLENLLGVPLRRGLGADGQVVDDHIGLGVAEDADDVVGLARRLRQDLG